MQTVLLLTIALHFFCAAHIVRNGHVIPWLFFILACPIAGCIIYYMVMMGLASQLLTAGTYVVRQVQGFADPHRDLREKRRRASLIGSADARRALAEECMKRGSFEEAVALFESAALGAHADDPVLLHGLARARFYNGDHAGAQKALEDLRATNPDWTSPKAHLLYARALEMQDKLSDALMEYDALIGYDGGAEARCRMAILLEKVGRREEARAIFGIVANRIARAPRHVRRAEEHWARVARRKLWLMTHF